MMYDIGIIGLSDNNRDVRHLFRVFKGYNSGFDGVIVDLKFDKIIYLCAIQDGMGAGNGK